MPYYANMNNAANVATKTSTSVLMHVTKTLESELLTACAKGERGTLAHRHRDG